MKKFPNYPRLSRNCCSPAGSYCVTGWNKAKKKENAMEHD
jgi:hypothetical protein